MVGGDRLKSILLTSLVPVCLLLTTACGNETQKHQEEYHTPIASISASTQEKSEDSEGSSGIYEQEETISLIIGEDIFSVILVDNSSTEALKGLLSKRDITINMSDYGGFEKVGSLGESLPTNDEQITTRLGDVILYQGNQLVIYYDTNSWSFTKLGIINNTDRLKEALGTGNVTITLSLQK